MCCVVVKLLQDSFGITIKMNRLDKTFDVRVKASDTIDNVKTKIERKREIPKEEYWLMHHAKILEDWPTLSVYGIKSASVVVMVG